VKVRTEFTPRALSGRKRQCVCPKIEVLGVLCFDTMGYMSDEANSQTLLEGTNRQAFQTHKVSEATIGNFLAIVGDSNAGKLIQSFGVYGQQKSVDLPHACLRLPFGYEAVATNMRDLVRSDHAPLGRQEYVDCS
jgi:hypothetical protein